MTLSYLLRKGGTGYEEMVVKLCMMDPDRTKRLQAILKWSLRQQQDEDDRVQGPTVTQMDPEVLSSLRLRYSGTYLCITVSDTHGSH